MKSTGRNFGELNGNAKLTAEKVKAIRRSRYHLSQRELAEIYGVHRTTIARIQMELIWPSVQPRPTEEP